MLVILSGLPGFFCGYPVPDRSGTFWDRHTVPVRPRAFGVHHPPGFPGAFTAIQSRIAWGFFYSAIQFRITRGLFGVHHPSGSPEDLFTYPVCPPRFPALIFLRWPRRQTSLSPDPLPRQLAKLAPLLALTRVSDYPGHDPLCLPSHGNQRPRLTSWLAIESRQGQPGHRKPEPSL